jgi:heme/copper-type cytochrome/quinol oxidase subunit 1
MHAYILVATHLFGLAAITQLIRAWAEGGTDFRAPLFLLSTAVCVAMTAWGIRLLVAKDD